VPHYTAFYQLIVLGEWNSANKCRWGCYVYGLNLPICSALNDHAMPQQAYNNNNKRAIVCRGYRTLVQFNFMMIFLLCRMRIEVHPR